LIEPRTLYQIFVSDSMIYTTLYAYELLS